MELFLSFKKTICTSGVLIGGNVDDIYALSPRH